MLFEDTSNLQPEIDLTDVARIESERPAIFDKVTLKEVDFAIRKAAKDKASGPDRIYNETLKLKARSLGPRLVHLYNNILFQGVYPTCWKMATTAIIRKANKPDYTQAGAYRPIALLNTLGKLLELILARRMAEWATKSGALPANHFGGRKGVDTEDATLNFDTWVRDRWAEKKTVIALFLDVQSAYPTVHPDRLIHILRHKGCPSHLWVIINDFLRDRRTVLRLDDYTSNVKEVPRGLPQGSPLLVILYILYNSELLNLHASPNATSIGYIDDVVHLVADRIQERAIQAMEGLASLSLEWGLRHAAIFDQTKTQVMILSKARNPAPCPTKFGFGNSLISFSTNVKWLGLMIDSKLTYHQHIGNITPKGATMLRALGRLGNSRWGLTEGDRVKLINAALLPRITYAAHV